MSRWIPVVSVILAVCGHAGVARATTGGPDVAAPLGWDPVDRKAFFTIRSLDESGRAPAVVYLAWRKGGDAVPVQVGWSRSADEDSTYSKQLERLRRRLRPLREESGPTMFDFRRVLEADTLRSPYWGRRARFRVEVSQAGICDCSFEVTTIIEPDVRMIRTFAVGPEGPRFGILSFRAKPYEMGYEVQIPVLLEAGSKRRIEWKPWE